MKKILDDASISGIKYDLTTMRPAVLNFALNSTNNSDYCVKVVSQMKFQNGISDEVVSSVPDSEYNEAPIAFLDVEVFPNLFLVCLKCPGPDSQIVRMINPEPMEIESLFRLRLIGFNCRRYDNHILYAAYLGYDNLQQYELSKKIMSESRNATFREAYSISYLDVYDMSSDKKSLKMFEVELGLKHSELLIEWDKPVPEDQWHKVAEYCDDDVIATEATFYARKADFMARGLHKN